MADKPIERVFRDLNALTAFVIQVIAVDATAQLTEDTPRDTSWARANWVPSIGAMFEEDLEGADPSPELVQVAFIQQQSAIAALLGYKSTKQGMVFISNNVPYIGRLNDGHSNQAPSGFVQIVIQETVDKVSKKIQRVR